MTKEKPTGGRKQKLDDQAWKLWQVIAKDEKMPSRERAIAQGMIELRTRLDSLDTRMGELEKLVATASRRGAD